LVNLKEVVPNPMAAGVVDREDVAVRLAAAKAMDRVLGESEEGPETLAEASLVAIGPGSTRAGRIRA
jgi:hypothetical protein